MNNQNQNEDEKAIIALGNIFKVFALIATVLTIAFLIYIAFHAELKVSLELETWSLEFLTSDLAI